MPYITAKVNTQVTAEQELALKTRLGKAIEFFPGKSEEWLMVHFQDNQRLWFKGDCTNPCAYVEVSLFGTLDRTAAVRMTGEVCRMFEEILNIPQSQTFVKYEQSEFWGWNGNNF